MKWTILLRNLYKFIIEAETESRLYQCDFMVRNLTMALSMDNMKDLDIITKLFEYQELIDQRMKLKKYQ